MDKQGLELKVDKFIFHFAPDAYFSRAGVWAKGEGSRVRVGLSDFTQQRNGDVAFVEVKEAGTAVRAGEEMGTVETIKANLSIPSPLNGVVVELNPDLDHSPELVNLDPYGRGWLALLAPADWEADRSKLLTAEGFLSLARAEAEEDLRK